jgi:hypothetical protein
MSNVTMVRPKVYYKLEFFYANHRKFMESRSYDQLRGVDINEEKAYDECGDGNNPCGMIAKYKFNDSYELMD